VCADAIEAAGVDRVVTMDLHAPQLQGFFHVPVDDLYAMPTPTRSAPTTPRPRTCSI
jgi:phosphoribosylpyrophosphate synthetase